MDDSNIKSFSIWLKEKLDSNEISFKKLSQEIEVSEKEIHNIICGINYPSNETIIKILSFLKIDKLPPELKKDLLYKEYDKGDSTEQLKEEIEILKEKLMRAEIGEKRNRSVAATLKKRNNTLCNQLEQKEREIDKLNTLLRFKKRDAA